MELVSEKNRTARKTHVCQDCRRTIEAGETYRIQAVKDYGDFWTWRSCLHCTSVARWLFSSAWGFDVGEGLVVGEYIDQIRDDYAELAGLGALVASRYRVDGELVSIDTLQELLQAAEPAAAA
jgi:RNase P subunit RPR2